MSKGTRQLAKAAKAADGAQKRLVRSVQKYGRVEHAKLGALFGTGHYYPLGTNALKALPPITAAWRKRKRKLGLSMKSGIASGATLKAANASASFIKTKDGFRISWPRANYMAKSPVPGYGPMRLQLYFRYFSSQRAQLSLGRLAPKQRNKILSNARADERKRMRRKIPNAKLRGSTLDMVVKVDGFRLPLRGV